MTPTQPNDFLTMLHSMTDDQLSSALAMDPELIKKAQKALLDAKQKKIEIDKQKSIALAAASGRPFDLKCWTRVKKLITGPYNEANALDFQSAIAKTDPNTAPEGEPSLMRISMDYLAERQSVPLEWPLAVFNAGAHFGYDEIASFIQLFVRRSGISGLGEPSRAMFARVFCLPQPWADHEAKLMAAKLIREVLPEFYRKHAFDGYHANGSSQEHRNWAALETLARAGCQPIPLEIDINVHRASMPWQFLASQPAESAEAAESKASAFGAMIALGWCDQGVTTVSDNLLVDGLKRNNLLNCGSRSSLAHLTLDGGGVKIFDMLCERESQMGFERYDAVGCSRLYFANERMRQIGAGDDKLGQQRVVLALAQRCMDMGDPPESVNPQNPLAKAANSQFLSLIASAIERRELGLVASAPGAPRVKGRSL